MIAELRGYALVFQSTHRLFLRAIDGVTDEQAMNRPATGNSFLWIAAHIVGVRGSFANAVGCDVVVPFARQFPRGGDPAAVTEWPTLEQLRESWNAVHAAFMNQLEHMTSEQVAAETRFPGLEPTILGVLGLATVHDAYHLGQLGEARRRLGLDRLVG